MTSALTPYLFRFAQPCLSPGNTPIPTDYKYDESDDMVHWLGSPERPAAINTHGHGGPPTKKKDLEKGEDSKDRRMWL